MSPDSPAATRYEAGVLVATHRAERRTAPPVAVVIHTTGSGPALRESDMLDKADRFDEWRKKHTIDGNGTTFDEAVWAFTRATKFSGHYVVGQRAGEVVQVVPEDLVAWHVGKAKSRAYSTPAWLDDEYQWWADRWPMHNSPVEFAGGNLWRGGSCNDATIGIEVAPPIDQPTGPWSDECWKNLGALVGDICLRRDIPCTATYVLTHSDAHPVARTRRGKPWDPGPRQWSWSRFCRMTGAPF